MDLEELDLSDDIKIQANTFDHLKNLKFLKLDIKSANIPEFLFKDLTKLKELSLGYISGLNNNHICGLDNLESLEVVCSFNGQIQNFLNVKTLTLNYFEFEEFSFKSFKNLETLSLKNPNFYNEIPNDFF